MNVHADESRSYWMQSVEMLSTQRLAQDRVVDVAIIGAGFGGLMTAYNLMKAGLSVCILEDSEIASGQSGRTSAHLSNVLGTRYYELERLHGLDNAKKIELSHRRAIEQIGHIIHTEKIECEWQSVDGYLFAANPDRLEELNKERECLHRMGLLEVQSFQHAPWEFFDTSLCLHFPHQAQFHPLKYLKGLAECLLRNQVEIATQTHVLEVSSDSSNFSQAKLHTRNGRTILANHVVYATNSPIQGPVSLHVKQAAYRTYVLAFEVPRASILPALYWDTSDPYHYVRIQKFSEASDLLIVGGEDHKTGQNDHPAECYSRLEAWAKQRFPMIMGIHDHWSGQVLEPHDGIAFLGRTSPGYYVITGDAGNGLTHATIGASIIADQIRNKPNEFEDLYAPQRVSLAAATSYVKENFSMASHYGRWLAPEHVTRLDQLDSGEGAIVQSGLEKIAAYKDNFGNLEFHSAVCPHLGCVVAWNTAEKSWDCPCHGSRFNGHGQVLEGPAVSDLAPKEFFTPVEPSAPAITQTRYTLTDVGLET